MEAPRTRYAVGIALLLLVVVIWVAASELMKYVFNEEEYSKPFFVTYLSTATFSLHLLVVAARALVQRCGRGGAAASNPGVASAASGGEADGADAMLLPPSTDGVRQSGGKVPAEEDDEEDDVLFETGQSTGADSADGPRSLGAIPLESLGAPFQEPAPSTITAHDAAATALASPFTLRQFCLVWFLANVFSNASLQYTTVTSSTILSSTSGFFTLVLGTLVQVEPWSPTKLMVVMISMAGVSLVSVSDSRHTASAPGSSEQSNGVAGDLLALSGAFMYGVYTTLLKKQIGHEDRIDMRLFFGFVGVFNVLLLWPGFLLLHYTGLETFELPSSRVMLELTLNAIVGTFISDYLWLLAMLMTSPVVVTLGLSLTIPLAILADFVLGDALPAMAMYWSGALLILGSFVIVNLDVVTTWVDGHIRAAVAAVHAAIARRRSRT